MVFLASWSALGVGRFHCVADDRHLSFLGFLVLSDLSEYIQQLSIVSNVYSTHDLDGTGLLSDLRSLQLYRLSRERFDTANILEPLLSPILRYESSSELIVRLSPVDHLHHKLHRLLRRDRPFPVWIGFHELLRHFEVWRRCKR